MTRPQHAFGDYQLEIYGAGLQGSCPGSPWRSRSSRAAETQAQCLQVLEQANSMGTAARASILAAFAAAQEYSPAT
jgi:hypothetical protein